MKTHGELFAGIGGFGLGADNAGMQTIWHVEIDKSAQSVLRRHWPNAQLESDVCEVGAHNLPHADVISFGSPCQDLSIAGKRKGLENGTRSSLFFEAIRIVRELNPEVAIWENVPGALSSNGGQDFRAVLSEMLRADVPMPRSGRWATAGMVRSGEVEVAWRILDAQYFGVAQRRRRVFVVASFGNGRAAEILFEPESLSGNTPPSRETGQGIADTFTIRSGKEGGGKGYLGQESSPMTLGGQPQYLAHQVMGSGKEVTGTIMANYGDKWGLGNQEAFSGEYHVLDDQGGSQMSISKGNIAPTLQSRMGTGGNNVPLVGIRRLTPLECERLQGFSDQHTAWGVNENGETVVQSDSARYKQLGNAVAVPVVEWICKRITGVK